jgi:DNA-nicking Smr family endonuclease
MASGAKKKNGRVYEPVVEAELDLHGYFADGAREATCEFLNEAYKKGLKRVRIIVGKGNRSENGVSVLPDVIKNFLNGEGYVFTCAKIQNGGEGALEVMI